MRNRATLYLYKEEGTNMAQYKSYTHVLRIDKDEIQGILCGDVVVMPKLDGTNACLFMKDGTVHAGSRTREINMNKDNANFCKTLTLNGEGEFPQIIKYLESHPDHIVYGEWLGAEGERFPGHIKDFMRNSIVTDMKHRKTLGTFAVMATSFHLIPASA